jgi:hypothetical protein
VPEVRRQPQRDATRPAGQPAHCRVIKLDHDCEGWRHEEVPGDDRRPLQHV